jgi:hypothetical protein
MYPSIKGVGGGIAGIKNVSIYGLGGDIVIEG